MKLNTYGKLLDFLRRLREAKIAFDLRQSRDDALMVKINVPGERWEVEFLESGEIEVERFQSGGEIQDETILDALVSRFSDEEHRKRPQGRNNVVRHTAR